MKIFASFLVTVLYFANQSNADLSSYSANEYKENPLKSNVESDKKILHDVPETKICKF